MLKKLKKLIFCLVIIAISLPGSLISVKAADIITPDNPILLTLEKPVNNTTMTGDIFLKGWSFSDVPLEKVQVYVDDILMGNADYGLARADIANKYPGLPYTANSGFTYKIRGLKDGKHVIKVVATNNNGKNVTSSTNVNVNNSKTPITGYASSSLTPQQMIRTLETYNKTKDYGYINNFVYTLIEEAKAEDIRSDILFSQIVLETSYLNFGGDVKDGQNNFAGIGATGNGNPGNSFPDVRTGLRVVVQHLKAYANNKALVNTCVDPRFNYVTRGSAAYVEYLGMNENPNGFGWAASSGYGYDIISILNRVKTLSAPIETSKVSSLTIENPLIAGNTIKFTTVADKANTFYEYSVKDLSNGSVTIVKKMSTGNTANWIPAKKGDYRVTVKVKNTYSNNAFDQESSKDVTIKDSIPVINTFKVTGTFNAGSPVNAEMTGTSLNGADVKFWLADRTTGVWTVIKDYDSRTSVQIPGLKNGVYRILGYMRDKSSNADYQVYDYKDIEIKEQPAKMNSLQVTGNYTEGSPIKIEALGTSVNGIETKVWLADRSADTWTVLKNYDSNTVVNYTIKKPGQYRVVVHIRDKYSRADLQDYDYKDIYIRENIPAIKTFNVTSTLKAGSPINVEMTGTSANGADVKFWLADRTTGIWTVLKDYDSRTSIQILGQKNGLYRILGYMRDKNSSADYQVYDYKDIYMEEQPAKMNSLQVTGNYTEGSPIKIEASGTSANGIETKVWLADRGTDTWTVLKDYDSNTVVNYTIKKPGQYRVVVHIRDKYSRADLQDYDYKDIYIKENIPVIKTFNVVGTLKAGSPINVEMTGTSANGADVKFWLADRTTGVWTVIKDYDSKTSIQIPGLKNGVYRILGYMRDKTSNLDYQVYDYKDIEIKEEPAAITSFDVLGNYKVNNPISINLTGSSANGIQYKVWLADRVNDKWTLIKDYDERTSFQYTITKPGAYRVAVYVRDKYSRSDYYTYTYKDILVDYQPTTTPKSVSITGNYKAGETLTAVADGTSSFGLLYEYFLVDKKDNKWTLLQGNTENNKLSFKIPYDGNFKLVTYFKDTFTPDNRDNYIIRDFITTEKVIVIDPGHGGKDPGAIGVHNGISYKESYYNLQVALKLKSKLQNLGYKVLMTRNTESEFLELNERANFANSVGASFFISIHHDSYEYAAANGLSTHYSTYRPNIDNEGVVLQDGIYYDNTPSEAAKVSANIANRLASSISNSTGYYNRGSRDHNLYVTRMTNMPSVLVECGFITNPTDITKITNPLIQDFIAQTIANEIAKSF